jgi:hypothetical protein
MKRYHFFEFHELDSCPPVLRNLLTEFLSHFSGMFRLYDSILPLLRDAVERSGATVILDLCSGAASPVLAIREDLENNGSPMPVILTDKFPNKEVFRGVEKKHDGAVTPLYRSVDATDVPFELSGFRTIFTAFHHFDRVEAGEILLDAVKKNQGIGIFEYTERSLAWAFYILNIPWVVWLLTPFIQPLRWQRLIFTYLIPVVPLLATVDGAVSCLRTYSEEELKGLVDYVERQTAGSGYRWRTGRVRTAYIMHITYLIGYPARP